MRKSNAKKEFRITWPFFFSCRSQSICKRPQHLLLPLVEEEEAQFIWMPTIQFTVNQVEMKFTRVIRQQFASALTNGTTKDKNAVRH